MKVRLPLTKLKNSQSFIDKPIPSKTGASFVIHDGPPYCSGNLHIGHALNKILKDITLRYRLLRGNNVYMRPGFDTHGLPVELKARNASAEPSKIRVEARKYATQCLKKQVSQFQSWNLLGDWNNPYKTMDTNYVINQLQIFYSLYKKGLIYRDYKPVYWSPINKTALAEAEIEYKEITSTSLYCRFKIKDSMYFIIWTTTPFSLPGNLAVAINAEIKYVVCKSNNVLYVCSQSFVPKLTSILGTIDSTEPIEAKELLKMTYKHPILNKTLPVLNASHVQDSQTGIVHTAPGHGLEDFEVCKENGIKPYCPINESGCFDESIPELKGLFALDSADAIQKLMKDSVMLVEPYKHQYPVDWRKGQPVIMRAALQFFCSVDKLKPDAIQAVESINFIPSHGKDKLLQSITSRSEWCISRQRFWGVGIPMMYLNGNPFMNDALFKHIISTIKQNGPDAWFTLPIKEFLPTELKYMSESLTIEDDTMDVWFDSGISWHLLSKPSDCVIEGNDQHRGWFQSSILTSIAMGKQAPTKQIITHGFVLDEKGRKMSKSIGNVVDPAKVIQNIGVDGLRLWVASTQFTKDVQIGNRTMDQIKRDLKKWRVIIKYLLGNLQDTLSHKPHHNDLAPMDKWLLAELAATHKVIMSHYSKYEYYLVVQSIHFFCFSKLSSPYIETIKDRLYCDSLESKRRQSAIYTLEVVLLTFLKWIAPIAPGLAEEAYHTLGQDQSVFELDYDKMDRFEDHSIVQEFTEIIQLRTTVNRLLNNAITSGFIASNMDAYVVLPLANHKFVDDLSDLLGVSKVIMQDCKDISVMKATKHKCLRCWKKICDQADTVCSRCMEA